ncbi:MAG: prenyl protease-related protein [Phycisphaerales bacterium]|jgi:CAAX prenyl protease-like protein|nr:prenyl protease-related protein [Phycisphaerales bacterium]
MPITPLEHQARSRRSFVRDDFAYMLPMGVFLLFTQAGVTWPALFQASYVAKTLIVAVMLIVLWPHYTKITWDYWWLGILFGIVGVVQWVGMEKGLLHLWPHYPRLSVEANNPFAQIHSDGLRWTFIGIRWAGAFLLVPVMEELFWRDFLWRTIQAPNDFKLAAVGERDWTACLIVAVIFSAVHIQWMTAIVWGLMVGGLLMLTRSLGACILMHAVTNLLLGWYVLKTGDWYFW